MNYYTINYNLVVHINMGKTCYIVCGQIIICTKLVGIFVLVKKLIYDILRFITSRMCVCMFVFTSTAILVGMGF